MDFRYPHRLQSAGVETIESQNLSMNTIVSDNRTPELTRPGSRTPGTGQKGRKSPAPLPKQPRNSKTEINGSQINEQKTPQKPTEVENSASKDLNISLTKDKERAPPPLSKDSFRRSARNFVKQPTKDSDKLQSSGPSQTSIIENKKSTTPEKEEKPKSANRYSNQEDSKELESDTTLRVVPLKAHESEIRKIFADYSQNVDEAIRRLFMFSVDDLVQMCNTGQDSRWYQVKKGNAFVGLAALNISSSNFTVRRLQLLYFTVTTREIYEEALGLLLDYLWKKDPCDDIWVGLNHTEDETGKLTVDKKIEEAYKKNNFRWKRITNDAVSGLRKTEYGVKRPDGVVSEFK